MTTNQIIQFFQWLWTLDGVKVITIHIVVNVGVALAAALRTGIFKAHKLSEFLIRKLAPYILIYGLIKAVAMDTTLAWLAPAALIIIEITLTANLLENAEILGLRLPQTVSQLVSKLNDLPADPAV